VAVSDEQLSAAARELQTLEGIDACPEGGATLAGLLELKAGGAIEAGEQVVLFNTGAGWLYRS
jgi:threonine synthase